MDLGIENNTALVTASSSGIGKASAMELAREGVDVVINGTNESKLQDAIADIESVAEGEVVARQGDITDENDIRDLVEFTVDSFGGINHLVTNAGGPPRQEFLDTSDEDWYYAFDMLVMSVVRLVRESAPYLREGDGGTIVNVTSFSVKMVIDALVLSNSLRMAIVGIEKTLSRELSPEIRSNAVLPGPVETQRMSNLFEYKVDQGDYETYEEAYEDRSAAIALGRMGEPREIGSLVAYLSSEQASFINGSALLVDGGRVRAMM